MRKSKDALRLESVAQRELDQARSTHGRENSAERGVGNFGGRGIGEIRVIPDVEEVRSETQFLALGDAEILDQRKIPILLEGPAINVAAQVAEGGSASGSGRISGATNGIGWGRESEVSGVQVTVIDQRVDVAVRVAVADGTAVDELRASYAGLQAADIGESCGVIQNGEGRAGLEDSNAAERPATQGCASPAFRIAEER